MSDSYTIDTAEGLPSEPIGGAEREAAAAQPTLQAREKPAAKASGGERRRKGRAKAKPAAAPAAARGNGKVLPKRVKPLKGERSGAFIQRVIMEGMNEGVTDTAFATAVRSFYPAQKTTHKDVAWNRWKLRQDGKLAKTR